MLTKEEIKFYLESIPLDADWERCGSVYLGLPRDNGVYEGFYLKKDNTEVELFRAWDSGESWVGVNISNNGFKIGHAIDVNFDKDYLKDKLELVEKIHNENNPPVKKHNEIGNFDKAVIEFRSKLKV